MSVSTDVCRDILDARDVLKQQLATTIVESVMNSGLDKTKCQELDTSIAGKIDVMFDRLVGRVQRKIESGT